MRNFSGAGGSYFSGGKESFSGRSGIAAARAGVRWQFSNNANTGEIRNPNVEIQKDPEIPRPRQSFDLFGFRPSDFFPPSAVSAPRSSLLSKPSPISKTALLSPLLRRTGRISAFGFRVFIRPSGFGFRICPGFLVCAYKSPPSGFPY